MKLLVQRVREARVTVDGKEISRAGLGMLVFIGIEKGDTIDQGGKLADKLLKLRIFEDPQGKMNRSVGEVGGEILLIPEFTLAGDCRKGTRPSFDLAETPDRARSLIQDFAAFLKSGGASVKEGSFGAHMEVSLVNDGPVTFILTSG